MSKSYANIVKLGLQEENNITNKFHSLDDNRTINKFRNNYNHSFFFNCIYYKINIQIILEVQKYVKIPELKTEISIIKQIPEYIKKSQNLDTKPGFSYKETKSLYNKADIEFMKNYNIFYLNLILVINDIEQKFQDFIFKKCGSSNYLTKSTEIYQGFNKYGQIYESLYIEKCVLFHDIVTFLVGDIIFTDVYEDIKEHNVFHKYKEYRKSDNYHSPIYIGSQNIYNILQDILNWLQYESNITMFQNLEKVIKNSLDKYLIPDLNNILIQYLK